MKSEPSFGPTFPDSKPLNFLAGKNTLSDNFISSLVNEFDAFITLSAPDCAPKGFSSTGDPSFAVYSSILGAPAINLPLLEVDGMPLGVQLIGYPQRDAELFKIAHWLLKLLNIVPS